MAVDGEKLVYLPPLLPPEVLDLLQMGSDFRRAQHTCKFNSVFAPKGSGKFGASGNGTHILDVGPLPLIIWTFVLGQSQDATAQHGDCQARGPSRGAGPAAPAVFGD